MFLRYNQQKPRRRRVALTLIELLVAISIMVVVMGSLGAMSHAVRDGSSYGESYGTATQHARVAMQRIAASVRGSTVSAAFPGFLVLTEEINGWDFPDTLIVWHPEGEAMAPDGLPRVSELRVYCPDPASPGDLIELTVPTDHRTVPDITDTATWRAEAERIKNSNGAVRVVLTNLLRTELASSAGSSLRGAVRFQPRYRPTDAEFADYYGGISGWSDLAWPQGIYTDSMGLRQAWVRMELQLTPAPSYASGQGDALPAIPFLGSAVRFYEVER